MDILFFDKETTTVNVVIIFFNFFFFSIFVTRLFLYTVAFLDRFFWSCLWLLTFEVNTLPLLISKLFEWEVEHFNKTFIRSHAYLLRPCVS